MPVIIDWQEDEPPTKEEQMILEEAVLVMEEQTKKDGKRVGILTANHKKIQEAIRIAKQMAEEQESKNESEDNQNQQ